MLPEAAFAPWFTLVWAPFAMAPVAAPVTLWPMFPSAPPPRAEFTPRLMPPSPWLIPLLIWPVTWLVAWLSAEQAALESWLAAWLAIWSKMPPELELAI